MAILKAGSDQGSDEKREALHVFPVTVKFTAEEHEAVTAFAKSRAVARGQWIRNVVLAELARVSQDRNAELAEIVGVRLLLVNVLRPIAAGQRVSVETFDKFLEQISTVKHELADKIIADRKK